MFHLLFAEDIQCHGRVQPISIQMVEFEPNLGPQVIRAANKLPKYSLTKHGQRGREPMAEVFLLQFQLQIL
jgi:hypothetical protein